MGQIDYNWSYAKDVCDIANQKIEVLRFNINLLKEQKRILNSIGEDSNLDRITMIYSDIFTQFENQMLAEHKEGLCDYRDVRDTNKDLLISNVENLIKILYNMLRKERQVKRFANTHDQRYIRKRF